MTHNYVRHCTTTLFATLNVLDDTMLGHCMRHHLQASEGERLARADPLPRPLVNAIENFFSATTHRRLRRDVFHSLVNLQAGYQSLACLAQCRSRTLRLNRHAREHRSQAETSECVSALALQDDFTLS